MAVNLVTRLLELRASDIPVQILFLEHLNLLCSQVIGILLLLRSSSIPLVTIRLAALSE